MTITDKQAVLSRIDARFRSGNSVPVERANITASEWGELRAALEAAEAARVGSVTLVGEPGDFAPSRIVVTPAAPSSAEQPAPGAPEADERERFEAWARDKGMSLKRLRDLPYIRMDSDVFVEVSTQSSWLAWQARAQSSAAPVSARDVVPDSALCPGCGMLVFTPPADARDGGNWTNADDVRRLARELDVAWNGEAGAAPAPALCDVVSQIVRELPPIMSDLHQFREILALRAEEGDAVTIPCDNPDFGGPNCAIEVSAWWTEYNERRFSGDTLAECLNAANSARQAAEADRAMGGE